MRLLNAETLLRVQKLYGSSESANLIHKTLSLITKDFNGRDVPDYAILSHTWSDGQEVSFQDILELSPTVRKRSGYHKLLGCATQAVGHKVQWIWCDTCCIDKTSSAELSEAINSMWKWYRNASWCYAYLADVVHPSAIRDSRWFRRGWTLQELIAPHDVFFYSQDWSLLGTKIDFLGLLSAITGVDEGVLGGADVNEASVAQRMSWAADRETTRIEDEAYCLLGIFDVNMPLLYGEGRKSFIRLQEEILKTSTDQSLFAWTIDADVESPHSYLCGMLAKSPKQFKLCGSTREKRMAGARMSVYSMSNLGLRITLPLVTTTQRGLSVGILQSVTPSSSEPVRHDTIYLQQLEDDIYARVISPSDTIALADPMQWREVNVLQWRMLPSVINIRLAHGVLMRIDNSEPNLWGFRETLPQELWYGGERIIPMPSRQTYKKHEPGKTQAEVPLALVFMICKGRYSAVSISLVSGPDDDQLWCRRFDFTYTELTRQGDDETTGFAKRRDETIALIQSDMTATPERHSRMNATRVHPYEFMALPATAGHDGISFHLCWIPKVLKNRIVIETRVRLSEPLADRLTSKALALRPSTNSENQRSQFQLLTSEHT